jgi:hypothetical protein
LEVQTFIDRDEKRGAKGKYGFIDKTEKEVIR